ncbi:MAG: hypothetical protein O4808_06345 [Trichodesmium sp. St17_bin3_1_1]|jgi:hypothetical protein|nr:hypothetical protein [Trichodesmium sp. St18_bin1]MDE5106690.1 hypothetical protein [Trichodesmium sp. St17_bin3_1_1]MDE5123356.1 hypothetical protein [Trichodesmium sp. St19_bin1]
MYFYLQGLSLLSGIALVPLSLERSHLNHCQGINSTGLRQRH